MPTLWPFAPAEEFTETMEWKSDVIRAYSAEQRIRFSSFPRRRFNCAYPLTQRQYERAKLIAEKVGGGTYYLPLWAERQTFSVSSGVSSITVDVSYSEYTAGGFAMLWTDDETCEVVTISSFGVDTIIISGTTSRAYTNALIMPCITAYSVDGFEAQRDVNKLVVVDTEWSVYDGAVNADSQYPTYRTYPAITDCPQIGAGGVSERFGWIVDSVDSGLNSGFHDPVVSQMSRSLSLAWMPQSLESLYILRAFFHSLYGRQKAFWVPDWTTGLELTADIESADTAINVRAVGLDVTNETGDIFIQDASGTQTRLRYTAVATSGTNEVLTLSAAAGIDLTIANASIVCRMRLCRLAQDRVEISHQNVGTGRYFAKVQVLCDEVPIP